MRQCHVIKRALLVGATYEKPLPILSGTVNDVNRMTLLLRHVYGFGTIEKICGEAASTQAILDRLKLVQEWAKMHPGCTVVLYLSGHGSRLQFTREVKTKDPKKKKQIAEMDEGFLPSDIGGQTLSGAQLKDPKTNAPRNGFVRSSGALVFPATSRFFNLTASLGANWRALYAFRSWHY